MFDRFLEIKYIDILQIKEYENNAKEHPEWQVKQIANSIQKFGFNDPIAIDENNTIIEGHGRYLAAKKLNLEMIPCIILDNLKEEEKRVYIIAHNKLTMNTGFDVEKLMYEINALKIEGINLEVIGFETSEIDEILNNNLEKEILDLEEDLEEERNKSEGLVCPCCGYKAKKKEFLECDIDG